MTNSQRLSAVRDTIDRWIRQHGKSAAETSELFAESIMIRDGFYCGRRFQTNDFRAVWFVEEDIVKIFQFETGQQVAKLGSDEITANVPQPATIKFTSPADPPAVNVPVANNPAAKRRAA